jgi:hypothetical protein
MANRAVAAFTSRPTTEFIRAPNVTAVLSLVRLGAEGLVPEGECVDNRQSKETIFKDQLISK